MLGYVFKTPLPMECTAPSWMQGERYEFSERFEGEFFQSLIDAARSVAARVFA